MRTLTLVLALAVGGAAAEPGLRPAISTKAAKQKKPSRTAQAAKRGGVGFIKALLHTDLQ